MITYFAITRKQHLLKFLIYIYRPTNSKISNLSYRNKSTKLSIVHSAENCKEKEFPFYWSR